MEVSRNISALYSNCDIVLMQRGQHKITDELIFTNHGGYIFHDSLGLESGSEEELRVIQGFVQQKVGARRLKDRLHAIWFVLS